MDRGVRDRRQHGKAIGRPGVQRRLPTAESWSQGTRLGVLAASMIILGYPGEVAFSFGARWIFWVLAMIPFLIIVGDLFIACAGRWPSSRRTCAAWSTPPVG